MVDSHDSSENGARMAPPAHDFRWEVGEDVIELFFRLDFALGVAKFGLMVNNKGPLNMSLSTCDIEEYDTRILNNYRSGRLTVHIAVLTVYGQTVGLMAAVGGDEQPELNYLPNEIKGRVRAPTT